MISDAVVWLLCPLAHFSMCQVKNLPTYQWVLQILFSNSYNKLFFLSHKLLYSAVWQYSYWRLCKSLESLHLLTNLAKRDPDYSPTSHTTSFCFVPFSAVTQFLLFLAPVIPIFNSVYLFQPQFSNRAISECWLCWDCLTSCGAGGRWTFSAPLLLSGAPGCGSPAGVMMRSLSVADALGSSGAVWLLVVRFPGLAVGAAGWML